MRRRWILLVVSILVAAIGTALVAVYVRQSNDRATAGQVRTDVLVAAQAIPAGTQAASIGEAVETRLIPRELLAPGAVARVGQLHGRAVGKIFPGEQIVAGMFATASTPSGLVVPADHVAVSVAVDDPGRVAGYVVPGSIVAVYVSGEGTTRLVLDSAQVIAVGLNPAIQPGGKTPPGPVVTLALTDLEAKALGIARSSGQIWFALKPS